MFLHINREQISDTDPSDIGVDVKIYGSLKVVRNTRESPDPPKRNNKKSIVIIKVETRNDKLFHH